MYSKVITFLQLLAEFSFVRQSETLRQETLMAACYLDMAAAIILLLTALKGFPELLKNDRKVI